MKKEVKKRINYYEDPDVIKYIQSVSSFKNGMSTYIREAVRQRIKREKKK